MDTFHFLNPQQRYQGHFSPENLVFNANLQEFANRVSILASLQTGGKLSSAEVYCQIEALWNTFEASTRSLSLG